MFGNSMLMRRLAQEAPLFRSYTAADGDAATASFAKPSGLVSGDGLIAVLAPRSNVSMTPPSGFTQRFLATDSNGNLGVYTKAAGGSEPATYDFTLGASERFTGLMLAYQHDPEVDVVGTAAIESANATTIAASSITALTQGTLLAFFATRTTGLTVSSGPAGMTQRGLTAATYLSMFAYDLRPSSAGSTGAKTLTFTGNANNRYGLLMQIK